jgi:hypothetical protein
LFCDSLCGELDGQVFVGCALLLQGLAESFGMMVNYEYCGNTNGKRVDYSGGKVHVAPTIVQL